MALFIGRLHPDTNDKDLEDLFYDFGALTRCEVKRGKGYGFVEYKDKRDAEDAMKDLQGKTILGNRIVIEFARGGKRSRGESSRSSDSNACFICGETGHWARDCPDADRDRKRRRSRSRSPRDRRRRSRSRSRSRSPRDRRSRRSKERRSRSRSPRESRRSRERSQSPRERSKSPVERSKGNDNADRSPSPKRKSRSPSPKSKSP